MPAFHLLEKSLKIHDSFVPTLHDYVRIAVKLGYKYEAEIALAKLESVVRHLNVDQAELRELRIAVHAV